MLSLAVSRRKDSPRSDKKEQNEHFPVRRKKKSRREKQKRVFLHFFFLTFHFFSLPFSFFITVPSTFSLNYQRTN